MARLNVVGLKDVSVYLDTAELSREEIKEIVMAGEAAAEEEWRRLITQFHHIRSGGMRDAVGHERYVERLGGGKVIVYPRGDVKTYTHVSPKRKKNSTRVLSQKDKAYIINYGRGNRKTAHMGDHFITRFSSERRMARRVRDAMEIKYDEIMEKLK